MPRVSNKQRIIDATVELMNRNGSSVGTTQLAEFLSISPGNLYYHFRNREEILAEVLRRLQADLDEVLLAKQDHESTAHWLAEIFIGGARVLWRYRFFFSAALELVNNNEQLAAQYRSFSTRGTQQVNDILKTVLSQASGAQKLSATERARVAETMWVLWTSWPRYIESVAVSRAPERDMLRNHESLEFLLKPYLDPAFYRSLVRYTGKLQRLED